MKTKHQLQLLKWLKLDTVWIEDKNGKYTLCKFGLVVKVISQSTFDAIKDELALHNISGKKLYSLK
jgi:hypothetical protein